MKILIALIVLEGIWISSLFVPYINKSQKLELKDYIFFKELDRDTKINLYRKGYVIVEIYKKIDLDFEKLHNIFNKKVIFEILDYNISQAFISNIYNYNNPIEVKNLTYEEIFKGICQIYSVPECIE
jgi:hypothetical protein